MKGAKVAGGSQLSQRFVEHRGRQAIEVVFEVPSHQQVRVMGEVEV